MVGGRWLWWGGVCVWGGGEVADEGVRLDGWMVCVGVGGGGGGGG